MAELSPPDVLLGGRERRRIGAGGIADAPVPVGSRVRAFAHLLGETCVAIFAGKPDAKALRKELPKSLDGAPMLLPLEYLPLRRALDQWFARVGIKPKVIGEFEDSALLSAFGRDGVGAFAAPSPPATT